MGAELTLSRGVQIPDELTVAHFWKDEKKAREYPFDAVRCSPLFVSC